MNAERKAWLKKLASSSHDAWMTQVRPPALDGTTRLETRRTVYVFEDGHCTEVMRRDDAPAQQDPFLGARIMGWLIGEEHVTTTWRPGARAILWRANASEDGQSMVALTSPAFAFVKVLSEDTLYDDDDDSPTSVLRPSGDERMSA